MHPASKCEKGVPPPKHVHSPAQSQELLLLLLPVVVLEQAMLGAAGMDKQGPPDLRSLPLQPKSKKYAFLQGQPASSSSKTNNVAPAGEGFREDPTDGDLPLQFARAGQQAVKSCHGLFRVHSNVPNNAARTWTIAHKKHSSFFLHRSLSLRGDCSSSKVIHMLSIKHCVATSCT